MKKIMLLGLVAIIMGSCAMSNEKKAEKLVSRIIKDNLAYPDSYESVGTSVDSCSWSVEDISGVVKMIGELGDLMEDCESKERKVLSAKITMDIDKPVWYDPSPYKYEEYNESKSEWENATAEYEKAKQERSAKLKEIKARILEHQNGDFCGWTIVHRYRASASKGEDLQVDEMCFFSDEEFTNGIGWPIRSMNIISKVINLIKTEESEEELIEALDEFMFLI